VAVICEKTDDLASIRGFGGEDQVFVTVGDLAREAVLERAGLARAHAVIVCTDDDTQNLILTLDIRALAPHVRIIVSVQREELKKTLTASGVTYVASPFEFSGRLVASAAFEPEVAKFVEDISSGITGDYDLQQYPIAAGSRFDGKTVKEIRDRLEEEDGPLLVGLAAARGGQWSIQPHPEKSSRVSAGDFLIVLGNDAQNERVAALLGGASQGR
jgi:voltage-gated potassium channel